MYYAYFHNSLLYQTSSKFELIWTKPDRFLTLYDFLHIQPLGLKDPNLQITPRQNVVLLAEKVKFMKWHGWDCWVK